MKERDFCVVLGATGDIGRAICRKLAGDGWSLYIHFNKNLKTAEQLQKELTEQFPHLIFQIVQADFSLEDGAARLAKQVRRVRAIIVANGQAVYKLLSETATEEMTALWKVHMQNPAAFIGKLSSQLREYERSYIVFIGSIWGNTGAAGEVIYSAVKGAQHAFVKAYAKEAAYSGIRVNAVAPGWIETGMNEKFDEEDRQLIVDEIPLMSTGTPADVAGVVNFLLSGQADYMTGEILKINGGWYI